MYTNVYHIVSPFLIPVLGIIAVHRWSPSVAYGDISNDLNGFHMGFGETVWLAEPES